MIMYKNLLRNQGRHILFKHIWRSSSRLRHKIFSWLNAHDRVNIRNMLMRRGMQLDDRFCPICNQQAEETLLHLFWDCTYAQMCWGILIPNKKGGTFVFEEILFAKAELPTHFGLDVVMRCWSIWIQRNRLVFRNIQPTVQNWRFTLGNELRLSR